MVALLNATHPRSEARGRLGLPLAQLTCLLNLLAFATVGVAAAASPGSAGSGASPRERVSISADWRFKRGDPDGIATDLRYDVRPNVAQSTDEKAADVMPEDAELIDTAGREVLKPWILPSGNAFIGDPAKRHVRPPGNRGGEVSCVQDDFDDSGWEKVNLPHDWAIEGPFLESGPYGGMGRLPSWGIGWYRKDLVIPASDKGRSIFLDVEPVSPAMGLRYLSAWRGEGGGL